MASNATTPRPGRLTRINHWLFRSRRHIAIGLAVDAALAAFGLPLWVHLALTVVFQLTIQLVGRL